MGIQISLQRFETKILGRRFQYSGLMEPVGPVLDFFNNVNRTTFPVYDVRVSAVHLGGPLSEISHSEVVVDGSEIGLVYFLDAEFRSRTQLLKNSDRVIAYTPHAVVRGDFHRGAETRMKDLFDVMQGSFFVLTNANIYPIVTLPAPFPREADLLILNRFQVDLYHAE